MMDNEKMRGDFEHDYEPISWDDEPTELNPREMGFMRGWQACAAQYEAKIATLESELAAFRESAKSSHSGVGDWCAPGPASEQKKRWMLVFEDRDRGTCVFDDEVEAYKMFARAEGGGWNCHLFQLAPRTPERKE